MARPKRARTDDTVDEEPPTRLDNNSTNARAADALLSAMRGTLVELARLATNPNPKAQADDNPAAERDRLAGAVLIATRAVDSMGEQMRRLVRGDGPEVALWPLTLAAHATRDLADRSGPGELWPRDGEAGEGDEGRDIGERGGGDGGRGGPSGFGGQNIFDRGLGGSASTQTEPEELAGLMARGWSERQEEEDGFDDFNNPFMIRRARSTNAIGVGAYGPRGANAVGLGLAPRGPRLRTVSVMDIDRALHDEERNAD